MKASKWMYNVMFALAAVLFLPLGLMANNIRIIGTPTVTKNESDKKTATINFTLAWDNSWKSSKPANYDAAWIFVKCWDGDQWNHVYLEKTGHVPGNIKPKTGTYRVQNRYKTSYLCPMTIEIGKSIVYKKWQVDPSEKADTGVVGVFLYRKDSLGSGNIEVPGISLLWDYTTQGFVYDDDLVVKVFAVEMVYVPEGAFWLGGKGDKAKHNYSFTANNTTFGTPFRVKSEDSIPCTASTASTTLAVNDNYGWNSSGGLPAAFPKGWNAFYIMKYEMTQQAYCDFLNTLNQGQQNGRIQANIESLSVTHGAWGNSQNPLHAWRNFVEVKRRAPEYVFGVDGNNNNTCDEGKWVKRTIDNYEDSCWIGTDGQDIAMNAVCFYDLMAYADFAGLRPMTELEYEKACRGDQAVREDEFAWGSNNYTFFFPGFHEGASDWMDNLSSTLTSFGWRNPLTGEERADPNGGYNAGATRAWGGSWWDGYQWPGPLRVGMFADSTTTRVAAGASYWGVMNMSDNLLEMCVHASYQAYGRRFVGKHGDGQLDAAGNAHISRHWCLDNHYYNYIFRGIRWYHERIKGCAGFGAESYMPWTGAYNYWGGCISSRWWCEHGRYGTDRDYPLNYYMCGIRCVRTANAKE